MAKISLSKLNLEKNTEINKITINGSEIEVLSYLPLSEKISMINIVVQESIEGRMVNPMLVDSLFHVYLVMAYTNISFTTAQKEKMLETYDLMEKNGLISEVVKAIPSNEYNDLVESLEQHVKATEVELNSIANVIKLSLDAMVETFGRASSELESLNLDSEKLKTVLAIAKDNGAI